MSMVPPKQKVNKAEELTYPSISNDKTKVLIHGAQHVLKRV